MPSIRAETASDHATIRDINKAAFEGDDEADLVDQLRSDGAVVASLVAVENGDVVGHILFSDLSIETADGAIGAAALAPMAVRPDRQRHGIGSALVRQGLLVCGERGIGAVVVLGHPNYYPRFGFSAELTRNLKAPFSGDAFMALELTPGILAAGPGTVRYASAFGIEDAASS